MHASSVAIDNNHTVLYYTDWQITICIYTCAIIIYIMHVYFQCKLQHIPAWAQGM